MKKVKESEIAGLKIGKKQIDRECMRVVVLITYVIWGA